MYTNKNQKITSSIVVRVPKYTSVEPLEMLSFGGTSKQLKKFKIDSSFANHLIQYNQTFDNHFENSISLNNSGNLVRDQEVVTNRA